jgi:hypothetical protein
MAMQSTPAKPLGMAWPLTAPEAFPSQLQNMMNETQNAMAAWMRRCQEATKAGIRSFQGLYTCKDPVAFACAYSEWLTKSMTLMAEQMHDAQEDALHCAAIVRQFVSTAFPLVPELGRAEPHPRAEARRVRSAAQRGGDPGHPHADVRRRDAV